MSDVVSPPGRSDRLHKTISDQRSPGQRDRDRVLYTSALRRLAGVTQVVSADQGHVFHNRLTHTLEVAQIARRLAEKVLQKQAPLAEELGGINADVVEAAALIHDLGHPPFGHAAEEELQAQALKLGDVFDGFEGNAQSFRIVTQLACRFEDCRGLDLTRATLNASLKYPWFRESKGGKKRKFGAYRSEEREFQWARELGPGLYQKSVEAELMDLADDIAYAVHDVEDFYRAGLIPLERLRASDNEVRDFVDKVLSRWNTLGKTAKRPKDKLASTLSEILGTLPIDRPYSGTREQRARLRTATSGLIGRYVSETRLEPPSGDSEKRVRLPAELAAEIEILKELTWQFVIFNPSLVAREAGQRRVVRGLFEAFLESARSGEARLLPVPYQEELLTLKATLGDQETAYVRVVIDLITSMSDLQAVRAYHRISGVSLGPVLEPLSS